MTLTEIFRQVLELDTKINDNKRIRNELSSKTYHLRDQNIDVMQAQKILDEKKKIMELYSLDESYASERSVLIQELMNDMSLIDANQIMINIDNVYWTVITYSVESNTGDSDLQLQYVKS
jgi:hypothetical protein